VIQRFLPSVSRGGVGHFTHGLCNALQKGGHNVTVFSEDPAPGDALYQVHRIASGNRSRWNPLTFPVRLRKQDFSSFDLIHAQGDDQLIKKGKIPTVRTLHGSSLSEAIYNGWYLFSPKHFFLHLYFYLWEQVAVQRANSTVVVSKKTADHYPGFATVIPNGIEFDDFSNAGETKSTNPSILFVGELHTRKRGKLVLEAFQKTVRQKLPTAELWMVCPETIKEENVLSFHSLDQQRLASLYAQAWVFCMPSSYEGFGRPYVEAMAAGTAVLATPNSGAMEILENGKYGMMIQDSELGEALCTLLMREDVREKFQKSGQEKARAYAWDKIVLQYEQVYDFVLRNTGVSKEVFRV
jgi:glycosyltransferase involved in cell wall biosynthesis